MYALGMGTLLRWRSHHTRETIYRRLHEMDEDLAVLRRETDAKERARQRWHIFRRMGQISRDLDRYAKLESARAQYAAEARPAA